MASNPAEFDYREMARECMREAEGTQDKTRKKTLIGMARMFNQTAMHAGDGASSRSGFHDEADGD